MSDATSDPAASPAACQQAFGALLAGRAGAVGDAALARALVVHRNTAAKAAQDALAANHPVIAALVGEEAFAACAAAFVAASPPRSPRLCVYGEGFGAFLKAYAPFAELPYLPQMAALERLCVEALFAADAPALGGDAFADGVDPNLRLALHPAARLLAATSPVGTIWLAHQPGGDPSALDAMAWDAQTLLVARPEGRVDVTILEPAASAFLAAIVDGGAAGATLGDAALSAVAVGDPAPAFSTLLLAGALAAAD